MRGLPGHSKRGGMADLVPNGAKEGSVVEPVGHSVLDKHVMCALHHLQHRRPLV